MRDYFTDDPGIERPEPNEDYYERLENRSRFSLHDAVEYDKDFVNWILNRETLDDSDRQNIADVISELAYQLLNTSETTKSFEDFCIKVLGKEWHEKMCAAWLKRKNRDMAKQLNSPELADTRGLYVINTHREEE